MKYLIVIVTLISMMFLTACGPTLRGKTPLAEIPLPTNEDGKFIFNTPPSVSVGHFTDQREESYIVKSYDKTSEPDDDVAVYVRDVIERLFKSMGVTVEEGAAVEARGYVKEWKVEVTSGFPASLKSRAVIVIELYDPANRLAYRGTYQGEANLQRVGVDVKDLQLALNFAMTEALSRVAKDKRLLNTITTF